MILATSKERLLQYLDFKKVSRTNFFKVTSLKRGLLDADKLKSKINEEHLAIILARYQDLNLKWLITGEGEMITKDESEDLHHISERISEFCKFRNLRDVDLVKLKCGSSQTVSFVLTGKQKPNSDFLRVLSEHFPELNMNWVLTGKDEMFIEATKNIAMESAVGYGKQNYLIDILNTKEQTIAKLNATIADQREEIGSLKEKVKGLHSDADSKENGGKRVAG